MDAQDGMHPCAEGVAEGALDRATRRVRFDRLPAAGILLRLDTGLVDVEGDNWVVARTDVLGAVARRVAGVDLEEGHTDSA